MNRTEFNKELEKLFESIRQKFLIKGYEYATQESVFINFDKGSSVTGLPPELVLDGYLTKHYVSYRDMLDEIKQGDLPPLELIDEKLGDIILYFILQKIMMENQEPPF
jgi:hypothetical protein